MLNSNFSYSVLRPWLPDGAEPAAGLQQRAGAGVLHQRWVDFAHYDFTRKDWNPSWWCVSCILQTTERKVARCSNTVLEPAGSAATQTVAMRNPIVAKEATTTSELQPSRSVLFFNCESLWHFGSKETQIKLLSSYFSFLFFLPCHQKQTLPCRANKHCNPEHGLFQVWVSRLFALQSKVWKIAEVIACQCSRLNISQNDLKVKTCVVNCWNLQHASIQMLAMDKTIIATSASSELHPSRAEFFFFFIVNCYEILVLKRTK